jgi:D-glycero-alpha-D-manno-heptose-7-phosphate kinase
LISQFSPKGFKVIKTNLTTKDEDFLNSTLFIFKAGDERSSSDIHKGIKRIHGHDTFIETMEKVVAIAREAEDAIVNRQFNEIGKILHKGWLQKRKLYKAISNERIDALYSDLVSKGATGGRLLGAGGGGYILVFVPLENQRDFLKKCLDDDLVYERVTIDRYGSRVIGENT